MKETIQTMSWLLSFIKRVPFQVGTAVILGIISYTSVIFIPYLGVTTLIQLLNGDVSLTRVGFLFIGAVLLRGIARYGEQYMNHFIAFHLLADVRHVLFKQLRRLAPAKLLQRNKGDYIAMVTSDVEMLEIFFAHTVSPVLIGSVMGIGLSVFYYTIHPMLAIVALLAYVSLGVLLPIRQYHQAKGLGDGYKTRLSEMNQTVIEMSEGRKDVQQYGLEEGMSQRLLERGESLNAISLKKSNQLCRIQTSMEWLIGLYSVLFVLLSVRLGVSTFSLMVGSVVFLSSFGPFIPLSMLGNDLLSTFSSAKRLHRLMKEEPVVEEVKNRKPLEKTTHIPMSGEAVSFSYGEQVVFDKLSFKLPTRGLIGIQGASGRGKSTLLYLLMRFWDPQSGRVTVNEEDIKRINTDELRDIQGLMGQQTDLFSGTVLDNVRLGRESATFEEVVQASQKASLHDWIMGLPEGYETRLKQGERDLSDGEKQRLGLARLFLQNAPIMLLDEPTSHLDYVNEQVILKAIFQERTQRLVAIVSHRDTTLTQVDESLQL